MTSGSSGGGSPLRRTFAPPAQSGTTDFEPLLAAWEASHADPSTRPAARVAAPALIRAMRRRAAQVSAPPEAPALRRRAIVLADRVRRESEVPGLRAELRVEGLLARLDAGEVVATPELHEQVVRLLAVADAYLPTAGMPAENPAGSPVGNPVGNRVENPVEDLAAAARLLTGALQALLHRTLHNDDSDSPLAFGPQSFLAPLRASTSYRLATTPLRTERPAPPAGPARRVLLVHGENRNFMADLVRRIEASGAELRVLDLTAPPEGLATPGFGTIVAERLARAAGREDAVPSTGPAPGSTAAELLAWPDLVVVDWAMEAAAWASLHVPDTARLAVRLHRIEAFSVQAHAVDYDRVDDLVVVAEHVAELARQALPLRPAQRVHVVPVVPELGQYPTAKREGARRTLALIGWQVPVKDVGWALDVVEGLRAHDPAWRLLLVGGGLGDQLTARSWNYKRASELRIAAAEADGAVERLGFRTDVPELLGDVGVILTTSKVEGCHVGFFEGVAAGAFPVARDWPWARPFAGGARSVMPPEWIVEDPPAAVARILAADEAGELAAQGLDASVYVRQRYGDAGARLGEALGLA